MNRLNKTHPIHRAPAGLEWRLFKKLHWLWLGGFAALAAGALSTRLWVLYHHQSQQEAWLQKMDYIFLGGALFHVSIMIAITVGCVLVIIMKGPQYTADSYPLPEEIKTK